MWWPGIWVAVAIVIIIGFVLWILPGMDATIRKILIGLAVVIALLGVLSAFLYHPAVYDPAPVRVTR